MKQKKGLVNFWTVTVAILLALVVWRVVIVWQFNRASGNSSATTQGLLQRDATGSVRRLAFLPLPGVPSRPQAHFQYHRSPVPPDKK